jgi:hypothetical protein
MVQLLCFGAKNVSKIGPKPWAMHPRLITVQLPKVVKASRVTRLGSFCHLGYFGELIVILFKYKVVQSNGDIFGYALLQQIFYIVTLMQFQNMVCYRYLKGFKSGLIKMFWTFILSFDTFFKLVDFL